jgi:hypothetical protein
MSADPFVTYLNLQHYSPIEVPREAFDPLTILGGTDPTALEPIGNLSDILTAGSAIPDIQRDDPAPNFSNRRQSAGEAKVGLNLLSKVLAFFGAGANASAEYGGATAFEFLFLGVMHDFVPLLRLAAAFDPQRVNASTLGSIAGVPLLYVVTDTLKSSTFGVLAYDGKHAAIQLDADAIRSVLDAHAGVQVSTDASHVVTYSGPKQLRFAFRAKQLTYDAATGRVTLSLDEHLLASRFAGGGPGAAPPADAYDVPAPGQKIRIVDR